MFHTFVSPNTYFTQQNNIYSSAGLKSFRHPISQSGFVRLHSNHSSSSAAAMAPKWSEPRGYHTHVSMRDMRKLVKDLPCNVTKAELQGQAAHNVYYTFNAEGDINPESQKKSWDAFHDWLTVCGHQYSVQNRVSLGYLKQRDMYQVMHSSDSSSAELRTCGCTTTARG